jgi:predicted nucleotide-binding protein
MSMPNPKSIAIVHGRNKAALDAITGFLHNLDLQPKKWERVIRDLGIASPHNFTVVEKLLDEVQAVVVLMTPDDEGYLRTPFRTAREPQYETRPTGQPRQNVLIEAGMSFALHPARTIIVEMGQLRSSSDFHGMNVVRIDQSDLTSSLNELAGRLETARCAVDRVGDDWLDTRKFAAALRAIKREERSPSNPIYRRSRRGQTLVEAVTDVGLVDIENRNDRQHSLPPADFYQSAKKELAITGISSARTFDEHVGVLEQLLKKGVRIKILILHPESTDIERLTSREGRGIANDIWQVLKIIHMKGFMDNPKFTLRLMDRIPPFTAAMVDGDLEGGEEASPAANAEVRVQPGTFHSTQHQGVILTLVNKPVQARRRTVNAAMPSGQHEGGFAYFAEDLRKQWGEAIQEIPDIGGNVKPVRKPHVFS